MFRSFRSKAYGLSTLLFLWSTWANCQAAQTTTFDELNVWSDPEETYYNGDAGIGSNMQGWTSGGVYFGNSFDERFGGFWNGFAYSRVRDVTTAGFTNQYAAYHLPGVGSDVSGTGNYAIAYAGNQTFFNLPSLSRIESVFLTNSTYSALSMLNGDSFSKKFGGDDGNDPDFFAVVFNGFDGLNGTGNLMGSNRVYLADYRFDDNSLDYLIDQWTEFEMDSLGAVRSVSLVFESSDVGQFGINTPTFVAMDNLSFVAIPEPGFFLLGCCAWVILGVRRKEVRVR